MTKPAQPETMILPADQPWWSANSRMALAIAVIIPLATLAFCIYYFPKAPFFQPDSSSYIGLGPIRPFGYPLILKTLFSFDGGLGLLVPLQLTLHFAGVVALVVMARSLMRYSVSIIGLAIIISFDGHDFLFDMTMLTDGVFLSLVLVSLALTIKTLQGKSLLWPATLGIVVGLCVWVRLAALAFLGLPILVGIALLVLGPRSNIVKVCVLGACLAFTLISHQVVRWITVDTFSHSENVGVSPFATNVLFTMPAELKTDYPELYGKVWRAVQPIQKEFLKATTASRKVSLIVGKGAPTYITVNSKIVKPYVLAHPEKFGQLVSEIGVGPVADRILLSFSKLMIKNYPLVVLKTGWLKFIASFQYGSLYPMQYYPFSEFETVYKTSTQTTSQFLVKYVPDSLYWYEQTKTSPLFINKEFPRIFGLTAGGYWHGLLGEIARKAIILIPVFFALAAFVRIIRDNLAGERPRILPLLIVILVPTALAYDFVVAFVEMPLSRYYYPMKPLLLLPSILFLDMAARYIFVHFQWIGLVKNWYNHTVMLPLEERKLEKKRPPS